MIYKEELTKAMSLLGEHPQTIFLGQSVLYMGQTMSPTLVGVPIQKKLELPIFEDTQMGLSIGLSLEGYIPVSLFSRFDFLLLACNQLVNHLDKIKELSCEQFNPKVIIRTIIGSTKPLYPGIQHCGDYTKAFRLLLKTIPVIKLNHPQDIMPAYKKALSSKGSTLLIEEGDKYNDWQ